MTMLILNAKTLVSALAALLLTAASSWAFVDATNAFGQTHRHGGGTSIVATLGSLVR
jgi:hypothetical protein